MTLEPKAITFALLCNLEYLALYVSEQIHARIPFTLLHAIPIPTPVPQIAIPRSTSPFITAIDTFSPQIG